MREQEKNILSHLQEGLPLVQAPYQALAHRIGVQENEVIDLISQYIDEKKIRRFGTVVRHREIGYQSNAMCVWSIPADQVDHIAEQMLKYSFVTLCYQRRTYPNWPYNLYCMIHGRDEDIVLKQLGQMTQEIELSRFAHKILFSLKCFKQRGAHYFPKKLDETDRQLINELQNDIEVCERPFLKLSQDLKITEAEVVRRVETLVENKTLSRFAPLYNVEGFGGQFILAAMHVPQQRYEEINQIVNSFDQVAHNYEREHHLNMWFVIATETPEHAQRAIQEIEKATGLEVLSMPKLKEFYLELKLKV